MTRCSKFFSSSAISHYRYSHDFLSISVPAFFYRFSRFCYTRFLPKATEGNRRQLKEIIVGALSKSLSSDIGSGIVIAGFGEKEYTPRMKDFLIEGRISGGLKYGEGPVESVIGSSKAQISAFAQRDIAVRFMSGVDHLYRAHEDGYMQELCTAYAEKVVSNLRGYSDKEKRDFKKQLVKYGDSLRREFKEKNQ